MLTSWNWICVREIFETLKTCCWSTVEGMCMSVVYLVQMIFDKKLHNLHLHTFFSFLNFFCHQILYLRFEHWHHFIPSHHLVAVWTQCLNCFCYSPLNLWKNASIILLFLVFIVLCYGSRLSSHSSPHTCPLWRLLFVTSYGAEAPTLWHPWPRRAIWSSFASSWHWLPGPYRDAPMQWQETYGTSV